MADKFKPNIIKELETKNRLTIIANHYGSLDMRLDCIKIPKIVFGDITGSDVDLCLSTLKQESSYVKYEYIQGNDPVELTLIIITPTVYNKQIGPKEVKYVSLSYFNMIGSIRLEDLKEIDKLSL